MHAVLAALCCTGFLFLLRRGGQQGPIIASYVVVTVSAAAVSAVFGMLWLGVDPAPGWAAIGWLLAVAGLALGAVVLGERPTAGQLVGCVLVLGSVVLATGRRPDARPGEHGGLAP